MRREPLDSLYNDLVEMPRTRKVLLIDDDVRDLEYLCRILEDQGYEVTSCTNYELGAKLAATGFFDAILVGQGGREFKGRVVIERAMELERCPTVVVVARAVDMNCYLEAMELGAVDYLENPVPPMEVKRVMNAMRRPGCLPGL